MAFWMILGFLVGGALLAVAGAALSGRRERALGRFAALAALPLIAAAAMTAYVFSEDDYRNDGTLRWDAYTSPGGELDDLFFVSVAAAAASAAVIAFGALSGRRSLLRAALFTAAAAVVMLVPTTIGFTAN